jgi:flagellar operon protein
VIDAIRGSTAVGGIQGTDASETRTGPSGGVAVAFGDALAAAGREQGLELSTHALKRLEQRQVDLQSDQLERLRQAMDALAAKGARQSLVMLDQVAYVVNPSARTVVTAMPAGTGTEAIFTKIDSVAIA